MMAGVTCLVPVDKNSTINWSEKLAFFVVIIAERSKSRGSKRPDIVIAGSFRTKNSKRFCAWVAVIIAELSWLKGSKRLEVVVISELSSSRSRKGLLEVAWLAVEFAGCRMLGLIVLSWARVALHFSSWYFGAFVVALLVAGIGTWVIVAVVVAVVAETWAIVTSFKLVRPVAVFVAFVGTWKCEKLEVGTTVNWDRKLLNVEAGPSF